MCRHPIAGQPGKGEPTMSLHSWLQNLRSALAPGRGRHRRRGSLRAATHRPCLEVLEARLTPSFGPAVSYPVGPDPVTVVTADFDNDGHLDLATANAGNSTVSVLFGDGQGGFGAASNFATGANPWSIAVGDFDGDGQLDLATPTNPNRRYVSLLLSNGDGTFRPPVTSYVSLEGTPIASVPPVPADFNTDGKTDLAFALAGTGATSVGVLLSNGRG